MRLLLTLFLCLLAVPSIAAENIVIERASTLETPALLPTAGVFLLITNNGTDADKLTGVKTDRAGMAMLHTMKVDDKGVMVMRPIKSLDVPAGKTTALAPANNHIMLSDLKEQMKKGDKFTLTLTFEKAGEKQVTVNVVSPDELTNSFPPEMSGDNIKKMQEIAEAANAEKSWKDRLRLKIQSFFRKDKAPADTSATTTNNTALPTRAEMEQRQAMDAMARDSKPGGVPSQTTPDTQPATTPSVAPVSPAVMPSDADPVAPVAPQSGPISAPAAHGAH